MAAKFIVPDWLIPEPTPPTPVDGHRVESLVNCFIAAKRDALFDAPDAFYRLEGGDAVDAEPAINQRLQDLRVATLDLARDDGERGALGPRLDAHIDEATDGIGRHVAAQRKVFQRNTLFERQALIRRAAELNAATPNTARTGSRSCASSAASPTLQLRSLQEGTREFCRVTPTDSCIRDRTRWICRRWLRWPASRGSPSSSAESASLLVPLIYRL